jgi:hypothetical protein
MVRMMRMEVGQKLAAAPRNGFQDLDALSSVKSAIIQATIDHTIAGRMGR